MATSNTLVNGNTTHDSYEPMRFSTVPASLEVRVSGGDADEAVEVDLEELMDDPTELCTLLENENAGRSYWVTVAMAYAKQNKLELAVDIITKGIEAMSTGPTQDRLHLYNCLCWLHLVRIRKAHRLRIGMVSSRVAPFAIAKSFHRACS